MEVHPLAEYRILACNPGSTSTKVAIFEDETPLLTATVRHPEAELAAFPKIVDQYPYRRGQILELLRGKGIPMESLHAVVGRGGLLRPLAGGTYRVNQRMLDDLFAGIGGEHASNLGAILAYDLARGRGIPAFIVDPVSVDEFNEFARLSGHPLLPRLSQSHALNLKAVARTVAARMGKRYEDVNFVVAHLGSGISVSAHRQGKMVDVNNANNEGPFSAERCGGLPTSLLIDLCYSGKFGHRELKDLILRRGGVFAYLGTKDVAEAEHRALGGDAQARLVLEAMAYQVAKEIGAQAAVLSGEVDRIIITGGMANSQYITGMIAGRVKRFAPVEIVPGEEELPALVQGALRVLRGKEEAKEYA